MGAQQQLEGGEIRCTLQFDLVKSIYTFNSFNNKDLFNMLYNKTDVDQYNLIFTNCHLQQLKVTMDVKSTMYNLDIKSVVHYYISTGKTILLRFYFLFLLVYFALLLFRLASSTSD
ncbi:GPR107 protein [Spatholobus suberectus]|nr:GPR107 protein [Spatholobus suberectus]